MKEMLSFLGYDPKKPRKAYISGPMTHIAKNNFPAFMKAQAELEKVGWIVLNPAKMDIDASQGYRGETEIPDRNPAQIRKFAETDLSAILTLKSENGDAVVLLDNWENSVGARTERSLAEWVGLRVLMLEEAIYARS